MSKVSGLRQILLFQQLIESINASAVGVFGHSLELCCHAILMQWYQKNFSISQAESLVCSVVG